MSKLFYFLLLLLMPVRLVAQSAADPNAIDFSGKMDTLADQSFIKNFGAGLVNADPYGDFYIGASGDGWNPLRYGGPFILNRTSYSSILRLPEIMADFTGTGKMDIIDNRPEYHQRIEGEPYFDSLGTTVFTVHG